MTWLLGSMGKLFSHYIHSTYKLTMFRFSYCHAMSLTTWKLPWCLGGCRKTMAASHGTNEICGALVVRDCCYQTRLAGRTTWTLYMETDHYWFIWKYRDDNGGVKWSFLRRPMHSGTSITGQLWQPTTFFQTWPITLDIKYACVCV